MEDIVMGAGKTCGTCKYWGTHPLSSPRDVRRRLCGRVPCDQQGYADEALFDLTTNATWLGPDGVREVLALRGEPSLVVDHGDGYMGALSCLADFGCVLWEAKES